MKVVVFFQRGNSSWSTTNFFDAAWKVSKFGVSSRLNTGRYGAEITSYLDTFYSVWVFRFNFDNQQLISLFLMHHNARQRVFQSQGRDCKMSKNLFKIIVCWLVTHIMSLLEFNWQIALFLLPLGFCLFRSALSIFNKRYKVFFGFRLRWGKADFAWPKEQHTKQCKQFDLVRV